MQFLVHNVGFMLVVVEIYHIVQIDDEEGNDEHTPNANENANKSPHCGFWVEVAITDGCQSNNDIPKCINK